MTTPRDDIAGLIERLRKRSEPSEYSTGDVLGEEAATQLDSLLEERFKLITDLADMKSRAISAEQERDALQARVKDQQEGMETIAKEHLELARDFDKLSEMSKASETLRKNALSVAEQWQDRATSLQQERDEAYERAAESQRALWFVLDANDGFTLEPADMESYPGDDRAEIVTTRNNCDGSISLKAAIRRLAGPEKEKPQ